MNKPLVSLIIDEKSGTSITKCIPENLLEGTFKDLVRYIAQPSQDEYNPAFSNEAEKRVAARIASWNRDIEANPKGATVNLLYMGENNRPSSQLISLDARVSDHLGNLLKTKIVQTEAGPQEVQHAGFMYKYQPVAGN